MPPSAGVKANSRSETRDTMTKDKTTFGASAYGGDRWSARTTSLRGEIGGLWTACGMDNEWAALRAMLLHRPGGELAASANDPDAVQMLEPVDVATAATEHDAMADAFRAHGVTVHYVGPEQPATPNQMFCADLLFMTLEGVILARPASTVRADEECQVARHLADLGMPLVRTLRGTATFEGADAMWLDHETVVVGRGMRTNSEAIDQITAVLGDMGVKNPGCRYAVRHHAPHGHAAFCRQGSRHRLAPAHAPCPGHGPPQAGL